MYVVGLFEFVTAAGKTSVMRAVRLNQIAGLQNPNNEIKDAKEANAIIKVIPPP